MDANLLINDCEVVVHGNSINGAGFHAKSAGNAADLTVFASRRRRPVIEAAVYCGELMFRDQADQIFRTSDDTFAACRAVVSVDVCQSIIDPNSVEFTDVIAVTKA